MKITQVDAFTNHPYGGNPAAVCLLESPCTDAWKQDVAREMNLSETAFLERDRDGFRLRWFTPQTEVDLCGHATLAAAHVLWEQGVLKRTEAARFFTRSGPLKAERTGNWIRLDFPVLQVQAAPARPDLAEALGVKPVWVGRSSINYLLEVDSDEIVRSAAPDFSRLKQIDVRGVILTSKSSGEYDFVSRYFAPRMGVDEDPVTGSAHCCLATYWQTRLGKSEFKAFQASRRGGELRILVQGERVALSGEAVTVLTGELMAVENTSLVIEPVLTPSEIETVKEFFLAYARSLDFSLCFQGFDRELRGLPGDYAPPGGALLLARSNGEFAGCVALKKLQDDVCEMKRLYVRSEYRSKGVGHSLVLAAFKEAKRHSYKTMRLDTVPSMKEAIALYRSLGFNEVPAYCADPVPGALFMETAV